MGSTKSSGLDFPNYSKIASSYKINGYKITIKCSQKNKKILQDMNL